MTTLTRNQVQQIIDAANAVITALAGTNEDVHPDNTTKMVRLYDELNDDYAPPKVVKELARIVLAAMQQEPKYWLSMHRFQSYLKFNKADAERDVAENGGLHIVPLYTAPPAPVVPTFDEWLEIRGSKPLGWVKDAMRESYDACRAAMLQVGNDSTSGKPLTITLPDTSSKAFWSGTGKSEVFHPDTYRRWVKEAIERHCTIAGIRVEVR